MLIDTHCHLDAPEFDPDRAELLDAARNAGIGAFVVPAVEAAGFDALAALAAREADVYPAFGIHPLYVGRAAEQDLEKVGAHLSGPKVVAVGEIGLDGFVADVPMALQERFFVAQLRIARDAGLPVILHVRRAVDLILKHLRRIEVPGGIAHAFNGSRRQAEVFIGMGFRLGYGGAMSYTGSRRIREMAATLPLESLVLETDAPDIPPGWAPGLRNRPDNLRRYAALLAELRGVPRAVLEAGLFDSTLAALPRLAALRTRSR